MNDQTPRQAHQTISSLWLDADNRADPKISFDFRNGGVTTIDTPIEMKTALKVFTAKYCHASLTGRLTFCHDPSGKGNVKIIVAPRSGLKFSLEMDVVFPHVYDLSGDRIIDLMYKQRETRQTTEDGETWHREAVLR